VNRNVETVERVFEALGRRDVEAALRDCDRDIEFTSLIGQLDGRSYHGHDGIRGFASELLEAWDVWLPTAERFEAEGDDVLALGSSQVRGRGSGVEITIEWGTVMRLREGRVFQARMYASAAEARAAFETLERP
jgi:ketosteroid isomerase-like protein